MPRKKSNWVDVFIRDELMRMYQEGMSIKDISEKTGIAKPLIGDVITGRRVIKVPSFGMLFGLYPNAQIVLTPENEFGKVLTKEDMGGIH